MRLWNECQLTFIAHCSTRHSAAKTGSVMTSTRILLQQKDSSDFCIGWEDGLQMKVRERELTLHIIMSQTIDVPDNKFEYPLETTTLSSSPSSMF